MLARMARRKRIRKAEGGGLTRDEKRRIVNIVGTSLMLVLLGLALYAVAFRGAQRPSASRTRALDRAASIEGRSQAECPTRIGEPWEFDAATQCHFDPGHGHWHLGSPPPVSQRGRADAMPAPAPPAPASNPEPEQVLPPGAEQE